MQQANSPLPKDWKPPVNPNNLPLPGNWKAPGSSTPPSLPPGQPKVPKPAPGSQAGGFTQTEGGTFATGTNIRIPRNMAEMTQQFRQQNPSLSSYRGMRDAQNAGPAPSDFMAQSVQPSPAPMNQAGPDMMRMPTQKAPMPQIPGMAPQAQAPYDPSRPASPDNMPGPVSQEQADAYNLDLQGGRFGAIDRKIGQFKGFTEDAYRKEAENLQKSAQNVMMDPRFSPEQRAQALERISQRAQEIQTGFQQGREFTNSTFGYDAPPPEEFADVQPVGLEPIGGNALRNPETGDIMRAARGPNGMLLPVTADQVEIDSLPEGTQYIDANSGKVETVGEGSSGRSRSSRSSMSGQSSGESQVPDQEELFSQFQKWNKGAEEGASPEEREQIIQAMSQVSDPEKRASIQAMLQTDPVAALQAIQAEGIQVDLSQARLSAFKRTYELQNQQKKSLGEMFGIGQEDKAKPPVDTNRYRVRQGTYGTSVIRRRGSDVDIPAVRNQNGEMVAAPVGPRQLADLETDTPFQNITSQKDGKQIRMLPFNSETIDLQDFSLPDSVRQSFGKELGKIRARNPEDWNAFADTLQKYQTIDEEWDPSNLSPKQEALMKVVGSFYGELNTPAKALMSMYIAHSLGYKIDTNGENPDGAQGFASTGFARDQSKGSRIAEISNTSNGGTFEGRRMEVTAKTSKAFSEAMRDIAYLDDPDKVYEMRPKVDRAVNTAVESILNEVVAEETDLANKVGTFGAGGEFEGMSPGKGPGKWNRWDRINALVEDMVNKSSGQTTNDEIRNKVMAEIQAKINSWSRENPDSRFGDYRSTFYNERTKQKVPANMAGKLRQSKLADEQKTADTQRQGRKTESEARNAANMNEMPKKPSAR